MKCESLKLLCCPACKGQLSFGGKGNSFIIREGDLCCRKCSGVYRIQESIPRFLNCESLRGLNKGFERAYNRISWIYDSAISKTYLHRRFWPSSGEDRARREITERLETYRGSSILETGIGTGDNIPHVVHCAADVKMYGLDLSAGMLSQCVRNLRKWKCEAELFLGNAEQLPFRDESFDVVFHVGGINFFTERGKAVEEMVRVAKAGTKISIACETEKVIESNSTAVRLVFGSRLAERMLQFRFREMLAYVPEHMLDVSFSRIWEGNGYLLEFRKPSVPF